MPMLRALTPVCHMHQRMYFPCTPTFTPHAPVFHVHLLPVTMLCTGPITCVCFSQDGQCTLTSSLDSTVRLLDKTTGEMLGE